MTKGESKRKIEKIERILSVWSSTSLEETPEKEELFGAPIFNFCKNDLISQNLKRSLNFVQGAHPPPASRRERTFVMFRICAEGAEFF
jgi:hypothetical protein